MGDILENHSSDKGDKGFVIYKEPLQYGNKKTIQFKNGQRAQVDIFSKEDIQLAKRYLKRFLTLAAIKEMKIKKLHEIPLKWL
jgi:hypothetical protein